MYRIFHCETPTMDSIQFLRYWFSNAQRIHYPMRSRLFGEDSLSRRFGDALRLEALTNFAFASPPRASQIQFLRYLPAQIQISS